MYILLTRSHAIGETVESSKWIKFKWKFISTRIGELWAKTNCSLVATNAENRLPKPNKRNGEIAKKKQKKDRISFSSVLNFKLKNFFRIIVGCYFFPIENNVDLIWFDSARSMCFAGGGKWQRNKNDINIVWFACDRTPNALSVSVSRIVRFVSRFFSYSAINLVNVITNSVCVCLCLLRCFFHRLLFPPRLVCVSGKIYWHALGGNRIQQVNKTDGTADKSNVQWNKHIRTFTGKTYLISSDDIWIICAFVFFSW